MPPPAPAEARPRAPGVTQRVAGFIEHLRLNGFTVGPSEAATALAFITEGGGLDQDVSRLGLKSLLAGDREEWDAFDELFEAYWLRRGRVRTRPAAGRDGTKRRGRPAIWSRHLPPESGGGSGGSPCAPEPEGGNGEAEEGKGRLVASHKTISHSTDLRQLTTPEEMAEAERVAARLAAAMRYRLTRRRRLAARGTEIDLRRTIRRNIGRGAELLDLRWRRRPSRPVNLVLLLDVSGSMKLYSRYFLSFVRGLLSQDIRADAYFFHTRLQRITDALREPDTLRALGRASLMAEGFGGGTRIATSLAAFNDRYAQRALDSRSIVIIMSDGYDTDPPEMLAAELARLKLRARRLVWLNPLLAWRDYEPVARGMAASLPYIDCFATAHSLASLAALESELSRL